eukprot:Skav202820  [mRNA]  locus=scaffold3852:93950:98746:- [translate_table: standard]
MTSRLVHTIVTVAKMQIQLLVVYCQPSTRQGAQHHNAQLIHAALDAAQQLPLPVFLAGDFNGDPLAWPCGHRLKDMGFVDLQHIFRAKYGTDMPPTCKSSTTPDGALCCPRFAPLIQRIQVLQEHHFDVHQVVLVDAAFPTEVMTYNRLHMPRTFLDFEVERNHVQQQFDQLVAAQQPYTLEQWGHQVEQAVHLALQQEDTQAAGLPRAYRGRCKPPKMKQVPVHGLTRVGRPGDYQPPCELHTFSTRRKVRQVRRLDSLVRGLRKMATKPELASTLLQEWRVILRCREFGPHFAWWVLEHLDWLYISWQLPTLDDAVSMYQLTKHHTDIAVAFDKQVWLDKLTYERDLDAKQGGHAKAHRRLKPPTQPFQHLQHATSDFAIAHPQPDGSLLLYVGDPASFAMQVPVQVDTVLCSILHKDAHSLTVQPTVGDHAWPHEVEVLQNGTTSEPNDIFHQLQRFWQQYWQTDDAKQLPDDLSHVLNPLEEGLLKDSLDIYSDRTWMVAVKDLNGNSARGTDGVGASELQWLPDTCIFSLRDVVQTQEDSFDDDYMVAKTFPVPKAVGSVDVTRLRPITVLPQVYRLWTKIFSAALLGLMSDRMPPSLTGFLPGKGPLDASFATQHRIELAHFHNQPCTGLSLDLLKCFNTIKRPAVATIMVYLGIDDKLVQRWLSALDSTQRCWCFQTWVSDLTPTNRGLPEGDAMSVAGMLLVAYTWVCNVHMVAPSAQLQAFADNWGWSLSDIDLHDAVVESTQQVVAFFGMTIDWTKSWLWATSLSLSKQLQQVFATLVPTCDLDCPRTATELGSQHTYRGPLRLGKLQERLNAAESRLATLVHLPHNLDVKVHLVNVAILPLAFFDIALHPLGSNHFDKMRTGIANALFGPSQSRNSAVAVAVCPKLLDPEVYAIRQVLLATRRFLLRCSPAQMQQFLELVIQHSGKYVHARGPAGTLKFYLQHLGWSIDETAAIQVDESFRFSLLTTTPKRIQWWINRFWETTVLAKHSNRKAWKNLPPMDLWTTKKVLATFPANKRALLIQEISVAFQTNVQQAVWDKSVTDKCKFCDEVDTRYHRIHTCAATQDLRDRHAALLHSVREHPQHLHELPVCFRHEDSDGLHLFWDLLDTPELEPTLYHRLDSVSGPHDMLTFYTDGSCQHNRVPLARHASFAVACDFATSDAERIELVRRLPPGAKLPSVKVLMVSRLPGEQSIPRAEIWAVLYLCERFDFVRVYVDSQVALTLLQRVLVMGHPRDAALTSEPDLAQKLWHVTRTGHYEFFEVDAHKEGDLDAPPLVRYHRLGNQIANDAAILAAHQMFPQVASHCAALATSLEASRTQLQDYYQYVLQLMKTRAILDSGEQAVQEIAQPDAPTFARFQLYAVPTPWEPTMPTFDQTHRFAWGPLWAQLFGQWLLELQWPTSDEGSVLHEAGITWLELVLSLCFYAKMWIPIRRTDDKGVMRLVCFLDHDHLQTYNVKYSELADTFYVMWKQHAALHNGQLAPAMTKGLVKSLYLQGANIFSSGLNRRPVMPFQHDIAPVLHTHLQTHKGPSMHVIPPIPFDVDQQQVSQTKKEITGSWIERCSLVSKATLEVRRNGTSQQRKLTFG